MKKRYIILAILFITVNFVIGDKIVKSNGGCLRGKIIEVIPEKYYRIKLADGNEYKVIYDDIVSVEFSESESTKDDDIQKSIVQKEIESAPVETNNTVNSRTTMDLNNSLKMSINRKDFLYIYDFLVLQDQARFWGTWSVAGFGLGIPLLAVGINSANETNDKTYLSPGIITIGIGLFSLYNLFRTKQEISRLRRTAFIIKVKKDSVQLAYAF